MRRRFFAAILAGPGSDLALSLLTSSANLFVSAAAELSSDDAGVLTGYHVVMTNIASGNAIAEIAALIGDTARANILSELMGGQALTAGELARAAGVSTQTTSGHLAKLRHAGLISLEKQQGRHRYFRITSPEIAHVMEALSLAVARGPKRYRPSGPKDEAMRFARTCYDHMAGQLGTSLTESLCGQGHVMLSDGAGLITEERRWFFCDFGIDLEPAIASKRPFCRTCLDWSERRPHLAGVARRCDIEPFARSRLDHPLVGQPRPSDYKDGAGRIFRTV